jgi:adenosylmethionine-8-amino-7-oxononanoate aminotransferase
MTMLDRDRAHVWHPYAPASHTGPLFEVVAAQGTRLRLADGREVVDGMSSWWAAIHGYGHPVLDAALKEQVDRFAHVMFGGLTHAPAVELAELLVEITPEPLQRVFFADSGSVAVEVALKMAVQHGLPEGRTKVLTVRGGYHGDTAGAMSVTDPEGGMHAMFAEHVVKQVFVPRPQTPYGTPLLDGDLDEVRAALKEHGHRIAAVVIEPVLQGAGGMWAYSPDYLRGLCELAREAGALVLFDEIATGFGRTGTLWALEHAGVVPDVLVIGKALTGGCMTLGAVLTTDAVATRIGTLMHGPTFMANPLACAVAQASVRLLVEQDWKAEVERLSARLSAGLEPLRGTPGVADVRVLGAVGVVELEQPVDMAVVQPALVDAGAWVRPFGTLLYTMPPYVSTDADVDVVTAAMRSVL